MFSKMFKAIQSRHLALLVYVSGFFLYALIPATRTGEHTRYFLILHFIHALSGIILLRSYPIPNPVQLVLLFLISRFALFGMFPWLSDDVFGYLFYGKATLHGINLYAITADDPSISYLRDSAYAMMAFKPYQNIYPPLATIMMALSSWVSGFFSTSLFTSLWTWKFLLFISEGLGLWIIFRWLRAKGYSYFPLLMYLAIPLTGIEGVGQAHNELLLLPMIAGLMMISEKPSNNTRSVILGILTAFLGLIKLYPIMLIVPIIVSSTSVKQRLITVLSCTMSILIISIPWFGGSLTGDHSAILGYASVLSFYHGTYFNGMILHVFRYLFEIFHIREWWLLAPKAVSILRILSVMAMSIYSTIKRHAMIYTFYLVLFVTIMISSKVHAWYLLPLIPLGSVLLRQSMPIISLLMMMTYMMYATDPPVESIMFESVLWCAMGSVLLMEIKGKLHIFDCGQSEVLT